MVVIPAVVVGVLIIVAIMVGLRFCNKKRAHQPVVIKDKMGGEMAHIDGVEPQYVMDPDEKSNIFARNIATPSRAGSRNSRRARIGPKDQDSVADARVGEDEDVKDAFDSMRMSMTSSYQMDTSSKALSKYLAYSHNETGRVFNDVTQSRREEGKEEAEE